MRQILLIQHIGKVHGNKLVHLSQSIMKLCDRLMLVINHCACLSCNNSQLVNELVRWLCKKIAEREIGSLFFISFGDGFCLALFLKASLGVIGRQL